MLLSEFCIVSPCVRKCAITLGLNEKFVHECRGELSEYDLNDYMRKDGFDINFQLVTDGYSGLHQACRKGRRGTVSVLLKHSEVRRSVSAIGGPDHQTPLSLAAEAIVIERIQGTYHFADLNRFQYSVCKLFRMVSKWFQCFDDQKRKFFN